MTSRVLRVFVSALLLALAPAALGQAILGTSGDGNRAALFPSPDQGLPTPAQTFVMGLPGNASPHGVASLGANQAMVSDFGNSRVFVVDIAAATLISTIDMTGFYNGTGTIATSPNLDTAIVAGSAGTVGQAAILKAPFDANPPNITRVSLPGRVASYQTQGIVFDASGRAFIYHTTGITIIAPPYDSAAIGNAITIPVANPNSGAIAITPDGQTLLTTDAVSSTTAMSTIKIFKAPFSSSTTPESLSLGVFDAPDGIGVTPDGQKALVGIVSKPRVLAVSAPFGAGSKVEEIPLPTGLGVLNQGFEDVGMSPDGNLAILTGQSNMAQLPALFLKAPFTASGATAYAVQVTGGRGAGAARFVRCDVPPSPSSLTIKVSGAPQAPISATDYLDVSWCKCGGSRFDWRINGDAYASTTDSTVTNVPPRARPGSTLPDMGMVQLFVRSFACSPEKGPSSVASSPVYSFAPPGAGFKASTTTARPNDTITFTDTSSPQATAWLWLFGEVGFSTQQNPTFAFTSPGTYGVRLIAANGSGATASPVQMITVSASSPPAAAAPPPRKLDAESAGGPIVDSRLALAEHRHTWLTLSAAEDAVVFVRLSRRGELLAERRIALGAGVAETVDLAAYVPPARAAHAELTIVADRPVAAELSEEDAR